MLLSVAILSILAGVSLPIAMSFRNDHELSVQVQTASEALRRAQQYSISARGDTTWGVNFQSEAITVFKGASYATRDVGYDEVEQMPATISVSYIGDVVYAKLTGYPSISGVQTFTSQSTGSSQSLTLNSKGMVEY